MPQELDMSTEYRAFSQTIWSQRLLEYPPSSAAPPVAVQDPPLNPHPPWHARGVRVPHECEDTPTFLESHQPLPPDSSSAPSRSISPLISETMRSRGERQDGCDVAAIDADKDPLKGGMGMRGILVGPRACRVEVEVEMIVGAPAGTVYLWLRLGDGRDRETYPQLHACGCNTSAGPNLNSETERSMKSGGKARLEARPKDPGLEKGLGT
ncbi:hypothetical protein K438DRAFT_1782889 [Mycena galopus ATCC 62051]|nr:hypothetical protein K438DRAFT_1782889 [Mycena galopus ATCC 62051]